MNSNFTLINLHIINKKYQKYGLDYIKKQRVKDKVQLLISFICDIIYMVMYFEYL